MTTSELSFVWVPIDSTPPTDNYIVHAGELAGRDIAPHDNSSVSWFDVAVVVGVTVLCGGVLLAHNRYQNYNRPHVLSEFDLGNFAKYKIDVQNYHIQSIPQNYYASFTLDVTNDRKHFVVINEGGTLKCGNLYYESQIGIVKDFVKTTHLKLCRSASYLVNSNR